MIQVSCDNGTISTFPKNLDTAVNCVRILDGKFNSVQWPTEIFGCCRQYTSSYPPMMIGVYRSCLRTTKHLLVGIVVSRKSTSWWTGNFHGTFRISSFLQSVNETLNSRHAPFKPLLVTAICIVLLNGLCLRVTKDAHKSAGIILLVNIFRKMVHFVDLHESITAAHCARVLIDTITLLVASWTNISRPVFHKYILTPLVKHTLNAPKIFTPVTSWNRWSDWTWQPCPRRDS